VWFVSFAVQSPEAFGGQEKVVPAGVAFNYGEFDGIKTGLSYVVPKDFRQSTKRRKNRRDST